MLSWSIYVLLDNGIPAYVGVTSNMKRRLKEHATVLGYKPSFYFVEHGTGECAVTESKWIEHFRGQGFTLRNKTTLGGEGLQTHRPETKARLSRMSKGRPKPKGFGERLSKATKGKPHNWSSEGLLNAQRTQFKPGINTFAQRTPEEQVLHRLQSKSRWDHISKEERTILSRQRNLITWAKRTPEERSQIGRKIAEARARNKTILGPAPETAV